jgi:hypothetical protein
VVRQRSRRRIVGASLLGLSIFAGLVVALTRREEPELSERRLSSEPAAPIQAGEQRAAPVPADVASAPTLEKDEVAAEAHPDPAPPEPPPKKPEPRPGGPKARKKIETSAQPTSGEAAAGTPGFKYFRPYPDTAPATGQDKSSSAPDVELETGHESGAPALEEPSKTPGNSE